MHLRLSYDADHSTQICLVQALKALFEEVQLRHAPPMVTGTQLYADLNKCSLLETASAE
jgi:hypothetical protein